MAGWGRTQPVQGCQQRGADVGGGPHDERRVSLPRPHTGGVAGHTIRWKFSKVELRVLRLLVEGMTCKQMAETRGVTTDCVKVHISSMMSRTGLSSKTKLAAVVISKRLIVNGF